MIRASVALRTIKGIHTIAWGLLVGCVLAIPIASSRCQHRAASWLIVVVAGEVMVLALNHGSCPLTAVAARYTGDRSDNFDIYLPQWIARYNRLLFGSLYAAGTVFALIRRFRARATRAQ